MTISVRKDLGSELAKMFLDDIQHQRGRYYYFLGGVSPWSGAGNKGITDVPPGGKINLSRREEDKIRSEIIFSRYISPNDASAVVRRIDWVSGTTYDYWDDTIDMEDKNFYVITANNRVYKCLDNGARFGGTNPSTVMPDIVSYYPFKTSDGYLWKYMYSVPAYAASRFGSLQYMPVKRAISDSFYNNGAVTDVTVLNEGSGYSNVALTVINISGATTGSGAAGKITVDGIGRITGVNITNGGTGYTKGVKVKVNSATGAGAELKAVITGGVITGVDIIKQGVGYVGTDNLVFQVGNAVLVPVINRSTGSIESVSIVDPGIGYVSAPTLSVFDPKSSGTGLYGNPTAILEAVEWKGSIVRVNIKDPGKNYAVDTATTISVLGDGKDAAFSPVVYDGRVVDVLVENPGSGYTDIILEVQSPTGSGAVVRGIIAQSDYKSDQIVVEQTAVEGAVYKIVVTNPGAGYSPGTRITAEGDGVGLVCEPIIEAGQIKGVNIINYGKNYTYVNFTITDPLRPSDEIPVNDRATMYAVLPPYGGHGKDAVSELLCRAVVINTPLRGEIIEQYNITQDFRIFGIIKNPTYISSGARYTKLDAYLAFRLKCIDTTAVIKDAVYIFGKEKFRVVEKTSTTVDVLPLTKVDTIPLGVFKKEDGHSNQFVTTELISSYTMNKYSGKLLYFSTEVPFEFTAEQSITIKTFITF